LTPSWIFSRWLACLVGALALVLVEAVALQHQLDASDSGPGGPALEDGPGGRMGTSGSGHAGGHHHHRQPAEPVGVEENDQEETIVVPQVSRSISASHGRPYERANGGSACSLDAVVWFSLFLLVNAFYVVVLLCKLRPVKFEKEIESWRERSRKPLPAPSNWPTSCPMLAPASMRCFSCIRRSIGGARYSRTNSSSEAVTASATICSRSTGSQCAKWRSASSGWVLRRSSTKLTRLIVLRPVPSVKYFGNNTSWIRPNVWRDETLPLLPTVALNSGKALIEKVYHVVEQPIIMRGGWDESMKPTTRRPYRSYRTIILAG
uniref:POPDC1-3 domain-containing protein n=1 Tax=Anopheles coluzzii TaxID=1518534 RepID=A0A8W7PQG7_ANOCL